jgi:hypothetical protein
MAIADYSDKKFRASYQAETKRILEAIRECEALDKRLNELLDKLYPTMDRARGAAALVVRTTEQVISNRNQRLALIKELKATKKDMADREIKIAQQDDAAKNDERASGVNASLLQSIQTMLKGGTAPAAAMLDPVGGDEPKNEGAALPSPAAALEPYEEEEERELPADISVGDTVSDPQGNLWVVGENGAERADVQAEEVYPDAEPQPYAVMADGRLILVVDINGA